jgi:hypothetical protein
MIEALSTREAYRNAWMTVREDVVRRVDAATIAAYTYVVIDRQA